MNDFRCESIPLCKLFAGDARYCVPPYQREYAWQDEHVDQLVEDLAGFHDGAAQDANRRYWLGTCVTCTGPDGVQDVVDGQQRLTTVSMLLASVRARLAADEGQEATAYQLKAMAEARRRGRGADGVVLVPRLDFASKGGQAAGAFSAIVRGQILDEESMPPEEWDAMQRDPSSRNMIRAQVCIERALSDWGRSTAELADFAQTLSNQVVVAVVSSSQQEEALQVFEGMNHRGVGLDAADLTKKLIFQEASSEDGSYARLGDRWKGMLAVLGSRPGPEPRPVRFLRYFVLSQFSDGSQAKAVTESASSLFRWLSEHKSDPRVGLTADSLVFAARLQDMASVYMNLRRFRAPDGSSCPPLDNLRSFARLSRTHVILLMAGCGLPSLLFASLARHLEHTVFVVTTCGDRPQVLEDVLLKAAAIVRPCTQEAHDACAEFLASQRRVRRNAFLGSLRQLRMAGGRDKDAARVRYALAKLAGWIEQQVSGESADVFMQRAATGGGMQMEHIFPLSSANRNLRRDLACSLGNLTLLDGSVNASLQAKPYRSKLAIYGKSTVTLTRVLAAPVASGRDTRSSRACKALSGMGLGQHASWDKADIEMRTEALARIAETVWDMGMGSQKPPVG